MRLLFLLIVAIASASKEVAETAKSLSGQQLVDYINSKQDLWTARLNTIPPTLGLLKSSKKIRKLAESRLLDIELPKQFDPRDKWPMCKSLWHIRDQSSCGSCWAFGATEAMTDRLCIASKGKIQVSLSANDLLSCCRECGYGCEGGYEDTAYNFYQKEGLVTGSDFAKHQGCRPYPFPKCEHHNNHTTFPPCHKSLYQTPKCEESCQKGYNKTYKQDKYFGLSSYDVGNDVEAIQKELYANGPITVGYNVYEDFLHYTGGIYKHTYGNLDGAHAVKMMGWGEENGKPYWLIANSWNADWGEKGFFRILRGTNECEIEQNVFAGLPDLKRSPGLSH